MCNEQQDIDDAGEHQQQQEEQHRFSRFLPPRRPRMSEDLFTTPMNWPLYDKVRKVWV